MPAQTHNFVNLIAFIALLSPFTSPFSRLVADFVVIVMCHCHVSLSYYCYCHVSFYHVVNGQL